MNTINHLFLSLLILAVTYALLRAMQALRLYLRFRGTRVITCPESHRPAAVDVAAGSLAAEALIREPHLRLRDCSRWPERRHCGQDCLQEVEADPGKCLAWNIVNNWYAGKECVYCHRPFGVIAWHDHRPALMTPDRRTVQWHELPAETLPDVLVTHLPVCWNYHMSETFRREHPDPVTDRS